MKYRYVKQKTVYIPEIEKNGVWTMFEKKNISKKLEYYAGVIQVMEVGKTLHNNSTLYSIDDILYFTTELGVTLFLTVVKISEEPEIVNFDHIKFKE